MKTKSTDIIMQNKIFSWIALATGSILLIPYLAMQYNWQVPDPGSSASDGVNWTLFDFIVMGTLLFGTGSLFVLLARKTRKHRVILGLAIFLAFLLIWAELAVGVFGSPFAGS